MLNAFLSGEVPAAIMADWCEERGISFPRAVLLLSRMRLLERSNKQVGRSRSGAAAGSSCWSLSNSREGSMFRTFSNRDWTPGSCSRASRAVRSISGSARPY